jgi:hypothetical protein
MGNIAKGESTRRSVTGRDRLLVRRPIILSLGSYPVVTRAFILY